MAIPLALVAVVGVMFVALGDTTFGLVIVLTSFISLFASWQWLGARRRTRRRRWANERQDSRRGR